ncbi:MAG: hypothetical protein KF724_01685 [Phycisphaeraceae bacterium]|nr:hypothetical protein [Phycisphaeraceae bacterium]
MSDARSLSPDRSPGDPSRAGAQPRRDGPDGEGPIPGTISGRVFVYWFGSFFVLLCIATIVGGCLVTGGVRRTASETDNAMRTLGWELLRWSAGHGGLFPTSENEFLDGLRVAVDPEPAPAPASPADPEAWPSDQRTALQGRRLANLPDALTRITIEWPTKPNLAPELSAGGKPMLPGTANAVRGWLTAWVEHHRQP